jgi:TolB-like protein/Tfp pilus assembly protein PilF
MGEVWRARDTRLDREVALKVLPPATLADETARARLLREARLASKLNHPHICTIHEVGEAEGQAFVAMELVEGQSLSGRLASGALPAEETLRYGVQVADALAHAHARGVVHRDLKSANIVITSEGRAKVLDFGLAKRLVDEDLSSEATVSRTSLTAPGTLAGTLAYMAPEQLRGQPADACSDIWALGVVLYEMASGGRPFRAATSVSLGSAILNEPPLPLPPATSGELRVVIERCLAKDPEQRYQRAGEVRAALETVQAGGTVPPSAVASARQRRRWIAGIAALAVVGAALVALDVGGLRGRLVGPAGAPPRAIKLAVLPFENLTGDPNQEYLSDGVTQEMISALGRLHPQGLSVIARTSVMRYKKSNTPTDQIGRELGVDYVLEGSAQREAGHVRISAELIQVRDQTQLWADVYDRQLAGILILQADVAKKVAGALALKLLPAEQARLASVRDVNPEAYDAYLKGSHYWPNLTPADLDTAQRYFELALTRDPNYAPAYAGIAIVWASRQQMGFTAPSAAGPKAKEAARKAVELDDSSAEAHFALASVLTFVDWDWARAEPEWKRAIELNPSYPDALVAHSHFLHIVGRPDEAMRQGERALALDPFNVIVQAFYAVDLLFVRRYDEAIAQARATLRQQPGAVVALATLWWAYRVKGMEKEALAGARDYYAFYGSPDFNAALDRGYAEAGYAGAMRRAAAALAAHSLKVNVNPVDVADLYIEAGDKDRAFEWLQKGFVGRDPTMPYIIWPQYDRLRSDPRFQDLLRRMGLPQR